MRPGALVPLEALRAIALERVLQLSGAELDRSDPHKWHTDQGALSVQGAKFFNWSQGKGSGGAIDLVMHLRGHDFRPAVQWLQRHFQKIPPTALNLPSEVELQLPSPNPRQLLRAQDYLMHQRALPRALLLPLIQSGDLYADARANVVFLLRGRRHEPVGAELRGTTPVRWRGMAPGSRKDLGYFSATGSPAPTAIILCESAIDALSCLALHPTSRCLSTAGTRPDPHWLKDLLRESLPIACGFDADPTGDSMAQRMIAHYPSIQRLRPPLPDWNDVLRAKLSSPPAFVQSNPPRNLRQWATSSESLTPLLGNPALLLGKRIHLHLQLSTGSLLVSLGGLFWVSAVGPKGHDFPNECAVSSEKSAPVPKVGLAF